jgi:hypothetical protein
LDSLDALCYEGDILIQMQSKEKLISLARKQLINPYAVRRLLSKIEIVPRQIIHDKVENRASSGVEARLIASWDGGAATDNAKVLHLMSYCAFRASCSQLPHFLCFRLEEDL